MNNFFKLCLDAILENNTATKCDLTNHIYNTISKDSNAFEFAPLPSIISITSPGKPEKPELISPLKVPKRKTGTKEGHAGLIHALAHIEFNAINLALDACYRFQNMPIEYYQDWMQVAKEEVYHFQLLEQHLINLDFSYGYFPAHNGLWDMAIRTEDDIIARMALVPRTLEARGLDAVPDMQKKLLASNDIRAIEILDIIHHDEIKHVSIGNTWFQYLCNQKNTNSEDTFFELLEKYNAPKIRGSFNRSDRIKAGFSNSELDKLLQYSSGQAL
ncbi:MAG: ferritin-like domain-containing protein [Burkholderiales bacterium]|nr:ferritin-like domain-containing protein [Burkholderiales bacterium]